MAILTILLTSTLAGAITLSEWRYRKPIPLTPGSAVAVVKIDRDVYIAARPDLADLRVRRDGEEIPYVLETLDATSQQREQSGEILDQSVVPGVGLHFTVRLTGGFRHNHVRLATSEVNFRQAVNIETSDDAKHWSMARSDGAIFDFSLGGRHLSSLTVEYPVSTRPYLRVTVHGWTRPDAVTAAYVDYREERPASRETRATLTPRITEDSKTQSTVLTLDTRTEGLPVDRIRTSTTSPSFHRAVDVETSSDGKDWSYLTQGAIARMPGEESLVIPVPETRRRFLRLRIYNRDDRPLTYGTVQLDGIIRRVKFLAPTGGSYWLYYGNERANSAVYDLPVILARRDHLEEAPWTAGAFEPNPEYRPPATPDKPWSERHPVILYTVLGGAVLGLGAATLRFAAGLRASQKL